MQTPEINIFICAYILSFLFLFLSPIHDNRGRRPLGRPRHRWVDNIRMDLVEVGWGDVDWLRIGTSGELL
jgi:hypothetical protein